MAKIDDLHKIATRLRIHSIAADHGGGQRASHFVLSAADLVAALFFGHMRYDPKNPHYHNNDRSFSPKATPRRCCTRPGRRPGCSRWRICSSCARSGSDLEGHPTPRLPFVGRGDRLAGPGLGVGVGMALCARPTTWTTALRPARRRRMRRGRGVGSGLAGGHLPTEQSDRHCGREPARPKPGHALRPRPRRLQASVSRPSAGAPRRLTGTTWTKSSKCSPRGPGRTAAGHPRQDLEGRRRLLPPGQGRMARQAAFERGEPAPAAELRPHVRDRHSHPRPSPMPAPKTTRRPRSRRSPTSRRHGRHARGLRQRAGPHRRSGPARRGDGWRHEELHLLGEVLQEVPGRFTECFIAEQCMVGVATASARAARCRLRPPSPASSPAPTTRFAWRASRWPT